MGEQPETVGGRPLWALPNPSGLNAHFRVEDLGRLYSDASRPWAVRCPGSGPAPERPW